MDLDLQQIIESQNQLSGVFWYLAGVIQSKSSLSYKVTFTFLKKIQTDFETYSIPPDSQMRIFDLLKNVQIAEAKHSVDTLVSEAQNSTKFLETEILTLIRKLQSSPLYSQKIEVKLEPSSSFICNLCGLSIFSKDLIILEECPHSFHKTCIAESTEAAIKRKEIRLACPVKTCQKEININELNGVIAPESLKFFQEYSFEFIVGSGKLGKIVECLNCREKFSCESNTLITCPKCQQSICSKCSRPRDSCACFAVVMRRQCPNCNVWVEKGEGNLTICKKCGFNYCFQCLKFKNDCKCRQ